MDSTLNDFKLLTSTCWIEKCFLLTIDMIKDNYAGRYRSGSISLFVLDASLL